MSEITPEQEARDVIERMGIEGAQSLSSGDVVELANLIAAVGAFTWDDVDRHRAMAADLRDSLGLRSFIHDERFADGTAKLQALYDWHTSMADRIEALLRPRGTRGDCVRFCAARHGCSNSAARLESARLACCASAPLRHPPRPAIHAVT